MNFGIDKFTSSEVKKQSKRGFPGKTKALDTPFYTTLKAFQFVINCSAVTFAVM